MEALVACWHVAANLSSGHFTGLFAHGFSGLDVVHAVPDVSAHSGLERSKAYSIPVFFSPNRTLLLELLLGFVLLTFLVPSFVYLVLL